MIPQVQSIVGDMKSQELWALLVRDRQSFVQTNRRQLAYRHAAENILPSEEEFYRIQTVCVSLTGLICQLETANADSHQFPARDIVTIKMMTRHDPTNEDEETEALRWRNYVDSYVLVSCAKRTICDYS